MSAAKKIPILPDAPNASVKASMVSPFWDIAFAGAISIGMYLLISVSFKPSSPDNAVALFVFNLSFVLNFPHFLVSYLLLYGDFGKHVFRDLRFFWAGVGAPLILGAVMLYGFAARSPHVLGWVLNSMYFFVGWHYVKQTFGAIVVTNALRKIFYNKPERWALKFNMFSLWGVSFVAMNAKDQAYSQMGIAYFALGFPQWLLTFSYAALMVSVIAVAVTQLQKFIREGVLPGGPAIFAYATIYLWLLPTLSHPMYAHMIPMFHSIQYLVFVYAFRKNKVESEIAEINSPAGRKHWLEGIWGYLLAAVALGALSFHFVPNAFDALNLVDTTLFGPSPAVFFATIFINIHHYFIDSVIWRGQNQEIRRHLFKVG